MVLGCWNDYCEVQSTANVDDFLRTQIFHVARSVAVAHTTMSKTVLHAVSNKNKRQSEGTHSRSSFNIDYFNPHV